MKLIAALELGGLFCIRAVLDSALLCASVDDDQLALGPARKIHVHVHVQSVMAVHACTSTVCMLYNMHQLSVICSQPHPQAHSQLLNVAL